MKLAIIGAGNVGGTLGATRRGMARDFAFAVVRR